MERNTRRVKIFECTWDEDYDKFVGNLMDIIEKFPTLEINVDEWIYWGDDWELVNEECSISEFAKYSYIGDFLVCENMKITFINYQETK